MVYWWEWWVKPSLTSLFWLGHLEKPFLLLFVSFVRLFQLHMGLPHQTSSLYSSQVTCLNFHCLCICFLPLTLTSLSLPSHAGLLPEFLLLGITSSCLQWKTSLKICHLCSTPSSLRAVSQGIPLTSSPKSWKSAFLKFRTLLLIYIQCMITASNLDVPSELICVGDQQLQ